MRKSLLIVVLAILSAVFSTWAPGAVVIGAVAMLVLAGGIAAFTILAGFNLLTGRADHPRRHAPI